MLFGRSENAQRPQCRRRLVQLRHRASFPSRPINFGLWSTTREHPAKEEQVTRLYRLNVSAKRRRGGWELNAKVLQPANRHRSAVNLWRLTTGHVRTAVHVQHLPGDVTSFRQINHRVRNFLRVSNRAHRERVSRKFFECFVQWGIDNARCDRVEADVCSSRIR